MPEEGLETHELREQLEEAKEHAHGHGHEPAAKWITWLSLSTALIAVFAAVASLYSGSLANDALLFKNEAIHKQAEASDEWARYQAKGIKEDLFDTQLRTLQLTAASSPDFEKVKKEFTAEIEKQRGKKAESFNTARGFEAERDTNNAESGHALHRHHQFARAVTVFQVAIALSAISALTRRKVIWFVSIAAGIAGIVFGAMGFLPSGEHGEGHAKGGEHAAPSASAAPSGAAGGAHGH